MPPVRWKDSSRRRALAPTGRTALARLRRSRITGPAARTAGMPASAVSPSESSAGRAAWANGPSWSTSRLMSGATSPRSVSTGVISSLSAPSRTIVGRSSRRKVGSRSMSASRSPRRSAVASATSLMLVSAPLTCRRSRASGFMIVSESTARSASRSFCLARIFRTSSTSRSAGSARRMTSDRSSPRPATPMPRSERMIDSRSRTGCRMMLLTRSRSTALPLRSTGSRCCPSPGPSSISSSAGGGSVPAARVWVGEHSTKRSPISDCGRTRHSASSRKSW